MIKIRRILCPIDFSDHSRRALDHAMAIARSHQSTVTVLYVFAPLPVAAVGLGPMGLETTVLSPIDRERLLDETKAFAATEDATGVTVEALVRGGSVAAEIVDQAVDMQADLLVMGTHGRSGFERLLLGSVTEKVLRKAPCPVMTVPTGLPDAVPAGPVLYKSILCPVDFSESSLKALTYATSMAVQAHGHLTVLHVDERDFEHADSIDGVAYDAGMTLGELLEARAQASRRRLEDVTADASTNCIVDTLLTNGTPWREVLRVAAERRSDLIVMGVQGRGVADLLFFGSTTQHVVRQASCPVLTLRGV
jgi:nucleotide-binding universal stress UspA family protein